MNVLSKLKKFAQKSYRDGYLRSHVGNGIAYQIQALRSKSGLTQQEFAEKTGKKQNVISRLERSGKGAVTINTLLDIATGMDVALIVRFASYPEFLAQTADMSEQALQPETIFESLDASTPQQPSPQFHIDIVPAITLQTDWQALSLTFSNSHSELTALLHPTPSQPLNMADYAAQFSRAH